MEDKTMNRAQDILFELSKLKGENLVDEQSDNQIKANAKKMVDNIEKKRKEGKYSDERRAELEKMFFANMKKIMNKSKK